jgi:ATP-dependent Clp protease adaptor protein ClpS
LIARAAAGARRPSGGHSARYSGGTMGSRAATKEQTETKTRPETSLAPPWNVIVHDDPVTLMTYVTRVFVQVFGYGQDKAHKLMMEVHQSGRSIVWTGAREQAEMYAQKLQAHHLLTTLEVVDG